MSVRRISRPPIIAPERALRSEASKFHDQIQLAHKMAPRAARFAPVSPAGGGWDLGSLYLGGSPLTHQPWSFAPVHHDVADAATQDALAQVETQDGVVVADAQQRQAEQAEAATTAASIAAELEAGKSLDLVAEERGLTRDEVIAELEAAGYEVETTGTARNGSDPRVTTIEDPQGGRTITETERYDGSDEITVAANGETTTSPTRDERGWTVEADYDPETGVTTTRYEDDLGDGTVEVVTELPNGVVIEETTPKDGETTTVVIVDGKETELTADQAITAEGCAGILDDVVGGKSLDEIAEELGLTRDQVIAQLEAAGYEVETAAPTSDNGDVESTEIIDAETGQVVAGHYSDHQHDAETIRYFDAEGNAVSRTEYGDGRVSETVTDQDGRQTTTVTEPVNGGETVEHEVEQDENLSAIAAQHGMTLEELAETNPELFDDDHNGGDLIHPGETVVIAGGTETTVTETANGYTLTTGSDGSMTLSYADGTAIAIAPGSLDESLARLLLSADPDSSDPATAKEGEIITFVIEGLLAGQSYEDLVAELETREVTLAAIESELGEAAIPVVETDAQDNQVINFQGEPPAGQAPSGGDWVPVKVDGVWYWADPEVAEVMAAKNVTLGELTALQASYEQGQAQLDVWALDPDYEEAMQAAEATLDEALNPHGYAWNRPEPEGSLEEARNRLSDANALLEQASGALEAYEECERLIGEAIVSQGKGEASRELDALFYEAEYQRTLGDELFADYTVGLLQSQFDAAGEDGYVDAQEGVEAVEITIGEQTVQVAPEVAEAYREIGLAALGEGGQPVGIQIDTDDDGTLEWQWVEAELAMSWIELQDAKAWQEALGSQLELAKAYAEFYSARNDIDPGQDIALLLLAQYNNDHPDLFEEDAYHSRLNGDYLGLFESQEIEVRDGQLWVVNHFENGDTQEQLTFALDDDSVRAEYRDTPLNMEWQELLSEANQNSLACGEDLLSNVAGLQGAELLAAVEQAAELRVAEMAAGETLNRVLAEQLGTALEDLDEQIDALQAEYEQLLAEHGSSSGVPLEDFAGEVPIEVAGQTVYVAPEVAEAYTENGMEALTESDLPVWIEIDTDQDGETEWHRVDPELAQCWIALSEARNLREATEETRSIAEAAANWYAHVRDHPMLDYAGLEESYLEAHEGQMLDERIQPRLEALYENGYDGTFRPVNEDDIAEVLNLDISTAESRDALDKITEQIRDIGGENAEIRIAPMFYVDDEVGVQQMALFEVRNDEGESRYVDAAGKEFEDLQDFQDNNSQFSEDGKLIVPENLQMTPGADGSFALDVVQARNVSAMDKVVDPLVGIGTTVATVASFIPPLTPVAAPLAIAGGTYLGGRAVYHQVNHLQHGGEWLEYESLMNVAMLLSTVLPMGSGALRAIGMMRSLNMSMSRAFLASIGAVRTGGDAGRFSQVWHAFPHAGQVGNYMQTAGGLNRAAYVLDAGAMTIGGGLMLVSYKDLLLYGDQMSGLQLADAITGLTTGAFGTGLGATGIRNFYRNNRNGAARADAEPVPAMALYEAGSDEPRRQVPSLPANDDVISPVSPLSLSRGQDRKVGRSLKGADKAELEATKLRDQAQSLEVEAGGAASKVEQLKTELADVRKLYRQARRDSSERQDLFDRLSELPGQIKKAEAEASMTRRNADRNVPRLEQKAARFDRKAENLRHSPMGKNFVGRDKDLLNWINPDLVDPKALKHYRATERAVAKAYDTLNTVSTKLENAQQRRIVAEAEVAHLTKALADTSSRVKRLKVMTRLHRANERLSKQDYSRMDLSRRIVGLRRDFGDQLVGLRDLLGYAAEPAVQAQNGGPTLPTRPARAGLQDALNLVANETQHLIDAGSASKQNLTTLKATLDAADEAYSRAQEAEQTARDAHAGSMEVRRLASLRVTAERAFRDAQEAYRQASKDDFSAAKISSQARALKDAVEKITWQDPQGRNRLPKLNVGKITYGLLVAHLAGGVFDHFTGSMAVSKVLASSEANTANYARSSASKNAWRGHNHSSIRAFNLAAYGDGLTGRKIIEKIIARAPLFGAKRLGRKQAHDFRSDYEQVAEAGKAYREARDALPAELRNAFPEPNFRIESSFDPSQHASSAPSPKDLAVLADRIIADDPAFAGQSRDAIVEDLTTRLGRAETSYNDLDAALRNTLNKFPAAVRGYRLERSKLPPELQPLLPDVQEGTSIASARRLAKPDAVNLPNKAVFEKFATDNNVDAGPIIIQFEKAKKQYAEIDKAANGKIDYKAAEKYPTSSMAPNTPVGLGFKSASFGFNFNGLLGWFSKHSPGADGLSWLNHLGFVGHMAVGSYCQAKYQLALRAVDDFNEAKPYANRTDEEHKVFDSLDAERKRWNTRNDLAGFASVARSIILGVVFWKHGMHEAAIACWVQGLSSAAWVEMQQGSISRFVSKASSLAKKDTYKGQGPEIPFTWKSAWNPETGEFGRKRRLPGNSWPQPEGKVREWSNRTKTAARWASIISGLAVPTLLYLATSGQLDDMLSTDDFFEKKMTLPPNGDPSALEAGWDIISNIFARAAEFDAIDQVDMSDELMETMLYGNETEAGHMPHGLYVEPVLPDQPTQLQRHPPELDQLGYRWVEATEGDSL